jgi:acyl-CoA synthetase (AMP-forming)/AMP-acid ligase II
MASFNRQSTFTAAFTTTPRPPRENVGLLLRNSPSFVYAYMAIVSLGAVASPSTTSSPP